MSTLTSDPSLHRLLSDLLSTPTPSHNEEVSYINSDDLNSDKNESYLNGGENNNPHFEQNYNDNDNDDNNDHLNPSKLNDVVLISSIIATTMERNCTAPFKDLLLQQLQQSEASISDITQSHHERFLRSCNSIVSLGDECKNISDEVLSGVQKLKDENVAEMVSKSEALRGLTRITNGAQFLERVLATAIGISKSMSVAEEAAEEGRLKEALEEVRERNEEGRNQGDTPRIKSANYIYIYPLSLLLPPLGR